MRLFRLILLPASLLSSQVAPPTPVPSAAPPPREAVVTLDQAVREALDHNLDLLAERYNLTISDTQMVTANLRPNPVVSSSGIYLPAFGSLDKIVGTGPTEFNARIDFRIELGGKRDRRMQLARVDREVSELGLRNSIRGIVYNVQAAFVDVLLAKENATLASANLRAFQGIVEINTARVAAGDLAKVELSRTQIAALQFQNAVQQSLLQLRQAKIRLQQLLGRTIPRDDFDISGGFRRDLTGRSLPELRTAAMQRRPDLLGIRAAEARSLADLRLQQAQGKIDLVVGTAYQHQFMRAFNGSTNTLSAFVSAPLPVFNRNQGEITRAQREAEQWTARARALESVIESDAQNSWQQYQTSQGLLENIEKNMLTQARDVRNTTEYSYRRGEASLIEFLDAQRAFNDTMQSYNSARADFARSLYLIDSVTAVDANASK